MGHLRSGIEPGRDSHNEAANHKALFSGDDQLFDALLIEICLRQTGLDFLRGFLQLINYGTFRVNFRKARQSERPNGPSILNINLYQDKNQLSLCQIIEIESKNGLWFA